VPLLKDHIVSHGANGDFQKSYGNAATIDITGIFPAICMSHFYTFLGITKIGDSIFNKAGSKLLDKLYRIFNEK
jgi:hypothetical protein